MCVAISFAYHFCRWYTSILSLRTKKSAGEAVIRCQYVPSCCAPTVCVFTPLSVPLACVSTTAFSSDLEVPRQPGQPSEGQSILCCIASWSSRQTHREWLDLGTHPALFSLQPSGLCSLQSPCITRTRNHGTDWSYVNMGSKPCPSSPALTMSIGLSKLKVACHILMLIEVP